MWMFAALNTVEPPVFERAIAMIVEREKPWQAERQALLDERVAVRLGELSRRLGDGAWLDGAFSAGDLLMASVLLRVKDSALLDAHPNLAAYLARAEARPAYRRAFEAQRAVFEKSSM